VHIIYVRRMIIRDTIPITDAGGAGEIAATVPPQKHLVSCTNCTKIWLPIDRKVTTTTDYIRHYRSHHSDMPATEKDESDMLSRMCNKRSRTEQTPWTLVSSASTVRNPGEVFNENTYRRLLTLFLVETNSSFRLIERESFGKLMRYCNGSVPNLSHQTVARDLRRMHDELKPRIQERFHKHVLEGGSFNITLDAWTSGNKIHYLGITAHWMDKDWDLNDTVIGFKRLLGSHTAENLCHTLLKFLREFKIESNIRCITADNHKVNDAMFDRLQARMPGWRKKHGQVRCMAHVMNLAAQKIISSLKAEAQETEASMADEEEGTRENTPGGVLKMCRRIMSKIRASNLLTEALSSQALAMDLKDLKALMDMRIRWVLFTPITHQMSILIIFVPV
jgi:hypothetical protein